MFETWIATLMALLAALTVAAGGGLSSTPGASTPPNPPTQAGASLPPPQAVKVVFIGQSKCYVAPDGYRCITPTGP
jgi:hypothetical protein